MTEFTGYKTGTTSFRDHWGVSHEKPRSKQVIWRISAYALIPCENGIIMVEPVMIPGKWMLPGGGIEPREAVIDGLRRECQEELHTGIALHSDIPRYFGERDFYSEWTKEYWHALFYVFPAEVSASYVRELPLSRPGDEEIVRVELVPLHRLTAELCHPVAWQVLSELKIR